MTLPPLLITNLASIYGFIATAKKTYYFNQNGLAHILES